MGFFINVNKFSLHAIYRIRLIRAFLAASPPHEGDRTHKSASDLHRLRPARQHRRSTILRAEKPFHVINAALNLVKGEQLAWQERKAESFTMSRLHCGSWHLGYRPSAQYGDAISLGTALTISGAAASPNMGYHSSPIVGFLMTLFNVRLGWWLGNPGQPGADTWRRSGPTLRGRAALFRGARNTTNCYQIRQSFRWRTLRESRPLRDGLAPLQVHRRRRCRAGFRLRLRGSGQRHSQDPDRSRHPDRSPGRLAAEDGGPVQPLRLRHDSLFRGR